MNPGTKHRETNSRFTNSQNLLPDLSLKKGMTSFLSRLDGGIVVQVTDGLQNQTDLN
jgi:hypothetical protein